MKRRRHRRFTRRLETNFFFRDKTFEGISSNISERGVFIRTRNPLSVGSPVDFVIFLPDGRRAKASGVVRRAVRTDSPLVKNGMGIEVRTCDRTYEELVREVSGGEAGAGPAVRENPFRTDSQAAGRLTEIRVCAGCGAKNRIPVAKLSLGPRCGRCGTALV